MREEKKKSERAEEVLFEKVNGKLEGSGGTLLWVNCLYAMAWCPLLVGQAWYSADIRAGSRD